MLNISEDHLCLQQRLFRNACNKAIWREIGRGINTEALISLFFRPTENEAWLIPSILNLIGLSNSLVRRAFNDSFDFKTLNPPYPTGTSKEKISPGDRNVAEQFIEKEVPVKSGTTSRVLTYTKQRLHAKYVLQMDEVSSLDETEFNLIDSFCSFQEGEHALSYKTLMKILFKDSVWNRSEKDFNCPHCALKNSPIEEQRTKFADHENLRKIQSQFYFETKDSLK